MSLKLKVHQITNPTSFGYPNWYSAVAYEKREIDIDGLAQHMADHNTPFSQGVIKGILTDMVSCIREQAMLGRKIRIDGLAIFKLGVQTIGADTYKEAKQRSKIKRVKLNSYPVGDFTSAELAATEIEWVDDYNPTNLRHYKITAVADNAATGTVSGSGTYTEGTEVTLIAKAKTGYVFSKWTDGNTSATRTITVSEAKQYVAVFVKKDNGDSPSGDNSQQTTDNSQNPSGNTPSGGQQTTDNGQQSGGDPDDSGLV
ncbi:MAG: hypothetical protein KBT15_02345 [Bacteroidales bacterium]|nr:hypothetical protein [Candidatus Minthousia equi]